MTGLSRPTDLFPGRFQTASWSYLSPATFFAMASPIPRDAPVITTVLSASFPIFLTKLIFLYLENI